MTHVFTVNFTNNLCLPLCVSIRWTLHWGRGYPGSRDGEPDDIRRFPAALRCVCLCCQPARHQNETYCTRTTRGTRWGHTKKYSLVFFEQNTKLDPDLTSVRTTNIVLTSSANVSHVIISVSNIGKQHFNNTEIRTPDFPRATTSQKCQKCMTSSKKVSSHYCLSQILYK